MTHNPHGIAPDEWRQSGYIISTDRSRLDDKALRCIHLFLSEQSYWAHGRTREEVVKSITHSLPFGIYEEATGELVGFARVVTDYVAFGWLSDVFVVPAHRGCGLSRWLVECVLAHPDLQTLRRFLLATQDAHGVYEPLGFRIVPGQDKYMERLAPNAFDTL